MSHYGAKISFKEKKNKVLKLSSLDTLGAEVESSKYIEEFADDKERFIPQIDFGEPENFAKFGSAEKYYEDSIKRVYKTYPYDGSRYERTAWLNSSSYLDLYVFDNLYPRTTGHVLFSPGTPADHADEDNKGETVHGKTYKYGIPTTKEYILIKGGPNKDPDSSSLKKAFPDITSKTYDDRGANIFNLSDNRESNLKIGGVDGNTVEFWLKKGVNTSTGYAWTYDEDNNAQNEVLFDLYNINAASSSHAYARFRIELDGKPNVISPLRVTYMSGANGCFQVPLGHGSGSTSGSIYVTDDTIADGNWHHYAIVIQNTGSNLLEPRKTSSAYSERHSNGTPIEDQEDFRSLRLDLYIDGYHNNTVFTGSSVDYVSASLHATIGALATAPSSSEGTFDGTTMLGAGKLSASMDDFRFWKKARTGGEIGKFWNNHVGGGTNVDTANTDLGVYYKFNEGITGKTATDNVVLDYSGRISNGTWTGYSSDSRSTKSAIVEASASVSEFKDPILYSFHSDVDTLLSEKKATGKAHDYQNPASLYHTMPEWMTSQDVASGGELKNLTQILASYFDTLALQIENLPRLRDISYPSSSYKPLPFADRLLESVGFITSDIFADATVVEEFLSIGDKKVYEDKLHNIKNLIYQNIYNNVHFIYKSKGTEKAFRNLIRCFGIDDNIVRLNAYANNSTFELKPNFRYTTERKKYVDFNARDRNEAVVYQMTGSGQVAATATNVLRADSFDYNDTFTVVVPTNAGGNGNTITVKWLDHNPAGGALPSAADKVIHIQGDPSGGDSDRRANLALVFNGTTDNTKVRFGSNTGGPDAVTDGIAGLTATEAAGTSYYVSLTATTLGTVGNEITVTDVVGTNTVQEDTLSNDKMTGGSGNAGQSYLKAVPANLAGAIGMTFECEAVFPKKVNIKSSAYYPYPYLTSSIFGVHTPLIDQAGDEHTQWADTDSANFQVVLYREKIESKNVKFALTSAADTLNFTSDNAVASHINTIKNYGLTSSLFYDVYDNQRWNFAVRIKPKTHPFRPLVSGSDIRDDVDDINLYHIDFYGVSYVGGIKRDSFHLTASLREAKAQQFVGNPKRLYIGAERTNITGAILQRADMKISSPRVWLTHLSNDEIDARARDAANYGVDHPYRNAYFMEGTGSRPVPKIETLALHWDFHNVTGSGPGGDLQVQDVSSGSTALSSRYGDLSQIINTHHAGVAYGFAANATGSVDVEYIFSARQQAPEIINSSDMIQILTQDDVRFRDQHRPINYFFALEKSMYQAVSEEMLNFFATIIDFNNLIGEPVHRFRRSYKGLEKLRQLFFERVRNIPEIEKYLHFYRWVDSSINDMAQQLFPASAAHSKNLRTVIESHVLERNKYQYRFPVIEERKGTEGERDPGEPPRIGNTDKHGLTATTGLIKAVIPTTKSELRGLDRALSPLAPDSGVYTKGGTFDENTNFSWWENSNEDNPNLPDDVNADRRQLSNVSGGALTTFDYALTGDVNENNFVAGNNSAQEGSVDIPSTSDVDADQNILSVITIAAGTGNETPQKEPGNDDEPGPKVPVSFDVAVSGVDDSVNTYATT